MNLPMYSSCAINIYYLSNFRVSPDVWVPVVDRGVRPFTTAEWWPPLSMVRHFDFCCSCARLEASVGLELSLIYLRRCLVYSQSSLSAD